MSDAQGTGSEVIRFDPNSGSAFSDLMDFLAPEEDGQEAPPEGAPSGVAPAGDGLAAAPNQGAAPANPAVATPPGGAAGQPPVAGESAAGAQLPATEGTSEVEASSFDTNWGEVATAIETRQVESLRNVSLGEIRQEYGSYFEALEKHPRELIGVTVPAADGSDRNETLKDSADAKDWQDAIRRQLVKELEDRTSRKTDDFIPVMETLHSSIDLFRSNRDLIPGTKQFDAELANEFMDFTSEFQVRIEGKFVGFSQPVQPMLNKIRTKLTAARATAAAAAPSQQQQQAAGQQRTPQGQFAAPQAGIQSRAGSAGGDGENFDTLFGVAGYAPGTIRI